MRWTGAPLTVRVWLTGCAALAWRSRAAIIAPYSVPV
jgi:hypothetical protein